LFFEGEQEKQDTRKQEDTEYAKFGACASYVAERANFEQNLATVAKIPTGNRNKNRENQKYFSPEMPSPTTEAAYCTVLTKTASPQPWTMEITIQMNAK
jgi:hypothetical protein